jgi:hypothetical protein
MNNYNSFYKHDRHIREPLQQVLALAVIRLNKETHYFILGLIDYVLRKFSDKNYWNRLQTLYQSSNYENKDSNSCNRSLSKYFEEMSESLTFLVRTIADRTMKW